jgi:hydroxymethylpyrimidine pyrophosphatase-like HAD family hydrolase
MIVSNKARCKKCGDTITSKSRHDFVPCSCGAIAVDGGRDYLKRTGDKEDIEELSEVYNDFGDYITHLLDPNYQYRIKVPKGVHINEIINCFIEQYPTCNLGIEL